VKVLQWWRRLDLPEGGELSMSQALRREVVEKCLATSGPPSQPFICEGWVSGLSTKQSTDRIGIEQTLVEN
jgi:hypothetical protein